jgi:FAD/FMN-containing dehydrogenase
MTTPYPSDSESFDRGALLRRGAGLAVALAGWQLVGSASGAVDPRLKALQKLVKGPVLAPSSSAYSQARLVYQARFDNVFPLGVVQPLSAADISPIVRWSKKAKVKLVIRGGGHSYAGYSTGSGLVVDLRRMSAVALSSSSGVVTVGAGARLIDVEAKLAPAGRAIPSGSCASVGIAGLALGGGHGFSSRKFGTTSDNVTSLGIVTADGAYLHASAHKNADLFWASRGGGGGNFGVVTYFDVMTHTVPDVSTFLITWPWSQAAAVMSAFQSFAPGAPDELAAACYLRSGTPQPAVECFGQFLGPQSQLSSVLGPLTSVSGANVTLASSSYLDAQLKWAGCTGKTIDQCHLAGDTPGGTLGRGNFVAKSDYVNSPLSAAALQTIVSWMEQSAPTSFGFGSLQFDAYGGAINRIPPAATAFVHRNALASAQYLAHWSTPSGQTAALTWLRGFYAAMRPYVSGFAYQNYIDPDLKSWRQAYYSTNYSRLAKIKATVDPGHVFSFAQAVGS